MINWANVRNSYRLMSGFVPVGMAEWNGLRSKDDGPETQYRWSLTMPGKPRAGTAETLEAAKVACEAALADWMRSAKMMSVA